MMYGESITSLQDSMTPIAIDEIMNKLTNPDNQVLDLVHKLQIIQSVDKKQYQGCKKKLPYIVCGHFTPAIRRTSNFAYTQYFILDIDHIADTALDIDELFDQLCEDSRVMLAFRSPSHNGIKLLFKLQEKCTDAGLYVLFYKAFCVSFAEKHQLDDLIDTRTCDVTRACFLGYDTKAYFRADAAPVDIQQYMDVEDAEAMHSLSKEVEKVLGPLEKQRAAREKERKLIEPAHDTLLKIKRLLNPKAAQKEEQKIVHVPEILHDVEKDLTAMIEDTGALVQCTDINYGKKIHVRIATMEAEINLFYGRKGFSVVRSPKRGTSPEMNDLMHAVILSYVNQL